MKKYAIEHGFIDNFGSYVSNENDDIFNTWHEALKEYSYQKNHVCDNNYISLNIMIYDNDGSIEDIKTIYTYSLKRR